MSFHGGMLGVLLAMVWYARSRQRPWLQVMDFVAPCVPTGLAAGRVGNFINGELWGRVADPSLPWGMVFRGAGDLPRHPSQVYQFLMEGVLLFVLLGRARLKHEPFASIRQPQSWTSRDVEDILFLGVMGVVVGGRIGYCLFYKPAYYLSHPLEIFAVWQGGMSFHGGMLGVLLAMVWYARSRQRPWLQVMDLSLIHI